MFKLANWTPSSTKCVHFKFDVSTGQRNSGTGQQTAEKVGNVKKGEHPAINLESN